MLFSPRVLYDDKTIKDNHFTLPACRKHSFTFKQLVVILVAMFTSHFYGFILCCHVNM